MTEPTESTEPALNDLEIDLLVRRYVREMTRYEEAARMVEDRLRRALRAQVVRSLLSSRAKHPDDLRGKLERKRADARYRFSALSDDMNRVITDLAGCRVMIYEFSDIEKVERIVRSVFELAEIENAFEQHRKVSGYRATHILVEVGDEEERLSLRGTICEVQITSLAAHVFNELEHDIGYKPHGAEPAQEKDSLEEVRSVTWLLDRSVERLLSERARSVREQTVALKTPEELQFALEQGAGRRLHGEFVRLFRLLSAVIQPLTTAALGPVAERLERGEAQAQALGLGAEDVDDVVYLALAMFDENAEEFEQFVREQRGPTRLLKKAVLRAVEERKKRQ